MTLSPRERWLLLGVLPLILALAVWHRAWRPYLVEREALLDAIAGHRQITAAARVADPIAQTAKPGPLAPRLTASAADYGLNLARLAPEAGGLRVALSEALFADLVPWLADLERDGMRVTTLQIDRRPELGVVAAQITVEVAQ